MSEVKLETEAQREAETAPKLLNLLFQWGLGALALSMPVVDKRSKAD